MGITLVTLLATFLLTTVGGQALTFAIQQNGESTKEAEDDVKATLDAFSKYSTDHIERETAIDQYGVRVSKTINSFALLGDKSIPPRTRDELRTERGSLPVPALQSTAEAIRLYFGEPLYQRFKLITRQYLAISNLSAIQIESKTLSTIELNRALYRARVLQENFDYTLINVVRCKRAAAEQIYIFHSKLTELHSCEATRPVAVASLLGAGGQGPLHSGFAGSAAESRTKPGRKL